MRILKSSGIGEIEEKKSRFIATLCSVETEEEAQRFFDETKKKYWDARHNCTAFVIGRDGNLTRCSDDGEPSGTAGRPMLSVLQHSGVRNVACVVTRYFGGTLLGTGGLIKAYSEAVQAALANSVLAEETEGVEIPFVLSYDAFGKIRYELERRNLKPEDAVFAEKVEAIVRVPAEREEEIRNLITDTTNGKAEIKESRACVILSEIEVTGE